MSGHGHHDADDHHSAHDDHHDETTSDDFPADEPRSPSWLPLLGGALLLAGIFTCVMMSSNDKSAVSAAEAAPAAPAPAAPASANRPTTPARPLNAIQKMALPPGHP